MRSPPTRRPPRAPAVKVEQHLSLQVWALAEAFGLRLERELASLGLSPAGFRLVGELMRAPGGVRHGELARRLGVKPPSLTTMVARLAAMGVVATTSDPDDARATVVRLAPGAPLGPGVEVLDRLDGVLTGRDGRASRAETARVLGVLLERLAEPR